MGAAQPGFVLVKPVDSAGAPITRSPCRIYPLKQDRLLLSCPSAFDEAQITHATCGTRSSLRRSAKTNGRSVVPAAV